MKVEVFAFCFPNGDYEIKAVTADDQGRILIADIMLCDAQFILCNIYAPTKNDDKAQCEFLLSVKGYMINFIGDSKQWCHKKQTRFLVDR